MELVIACRSKLSTLFGCTDSRNVVFSLNVTTALNTLMAGLLTREDHVLVSGVEHNAVMRALVLHRIPYSVIPCDKDGRIIVEAMPELVGARTKALFLTSASNVTGTIQPIREAGKPPIGWASGPASTPPRGRQPSIAALKKGSSMRLRSPVTRDLQDLRESAAWFFHPILQIALLPRLEEERAAEVKALPCPTCCRTGLRRGRRTLSA